MSGCHFALFYIACLQANSIFIQGKAGQECPGYRTQLMSFRTFELSDPRFETAGLRHITVKSPNLKGRGDVTIWLPPIDSANQEPLPLVILLHGVYGSHWAWSMKGGAHRTAESLIRNGQIRPVALAMPSDGLWGDGSGYLPHNGHHFDQWIVDDVPKLVAQSCPLVTEYSPLFVAGLSMGGFGALRLGAMYPTRFRAMAGLSSITHLDQFAQFVEEPLSYYRQPNPAHESVLAQLLANQTHLPPFRFDCGTEDPLLNYNQELHLALTQHNIRHTYAEYPGGHEWPYWEAHLADVLRFFDAQY